MRFLSLFASRFKFGLLLAASLLATSVQAVVVTVEGDRIKAGDLVVGTASTCTDDSGRTYQVLTFTSTAQTWEWAVPSGVETLDYLVVGGGGGGGFQMGGGGGGGGVLYKKGESVSPGSTLEILVGQGGAGAYSVSGNATMTAAAVNGNPSRIVSLNVEVPGGGAGGKLDNAGAAGASGGGGGGRGKAGGATTYSQYEGGASCSGGAGAGGGGAGGQGSPSSGAFNSTTGDSYAGAGGVGRGCDITGENIVYAGGGGGGGVCNSDAAHLYARGGTGTDGGGDGASWTVLEGVYKSVQATPGADGRGAGGGGGGHGTNGYYDGAKGGDGVVILRYLIPMIPTKTALKSVALLSSGCTYDGNSHQSSIVISEVLDDDGKPVNSDAYSVAYQRDDSDVTDWTSEGRIVVKVTAEDVSDYSGTVSATYTIEPAEVTSLTFTPNSFTHDGETKRPEVTVRAGTMTLAASDYDVTAGAVEGSELGTYEVTVTGKGNFTGTASASWSIVSCQHAYEQIPPKRPTCTEDGWADDGWRCKTCGVTNVLPTVLAALGHDWTDWTVTTPATLTAEGVQERDCLRCGRHETQSVPTIGWTFYPEKDSGYSGGTGTYTDGIISNSVGQILNVYFETGSTANLVVGAKKTLPDGNYYMAVNPRCAVTNVIDLTGGVKDCGDSSKRYALTQIGQFAFYSYSDTKVERYLKFRPAVDKILLPEELEVIATRAFGTSTADNRLKEIGYSGTRLTTIEGYAFTRLYVLKSDVQSFFTESLTSVGQQAFAWCYGMTGRLDTRNVASFPDNAFVHMKNVKDVYLTKVEELNTGAFGAYFEGKVTFHFRNEGATLKGAGVFGHSSASTLRMLFPRKAPNLDETGCSSTDGGGIFRGGKNLWTKGKHTYLVFDRTLTEPDRDSLGWAALRKIQQDADATAFAGATIDTSINGVTKETVAADLECEPADVELYGIYETSYQIHALAIVGVDPAYFSTETDYTWNQPAGGDWATGANWSPNGVPDGEKKTAKFLTHWSDDLVTVTSDSDRTLKAILFSESETLLDFCGHELKGPTPHTLALDAQGADVGFRSGTFAFTNSWFTGDRTLSVLGGANVSFTGDGNQTVRGTPATYVAPLDFYWVHYPSGKEVKEDTHPNVVVSDGGSLTVAASPGTAALSNFMLENVWGRGEVNGGTLTYSNNGDTSATMTFTNGLVVTGGGSVTGASKLVLKGGETDIAAGSTVDFTSLSVEGPAKGVIAAAGGVLGVTLTSAATGAELTFSGIALGDVGDSASQTTLTFGDGATGSGNLNCTGSGCTTVFDGGTFTVPDGKTFALGTSPTIKFALPVDGYAAAPLTVQCSGGLGDGTVIAIDASQYKGTTYAGGIVPLVKMASAITNLDTLREDATGIPSGMQLALATGDSTMLVLAPSGYTVTFDANGGQPPEQYKSVGYDEQYGTFPEVTRSGYKFAGWFTAADGGTQKYPFEKVTDNQTLYAHWERTRGLILIFGPAEDL